ncbi:hypothetical protein B0H12DRAFT_1310933 [Mycena haematopus]|nr:hypothetical protein B0H12DRAFT_1310933 [Mycena haematopus]
MPRSNDTHSDRGRDDGANMVVERSAASSTVRMMPYERFEVLQRANDDMTTRLQDAECKNPA